MAFKTLKNFMFNDECIRRKIARMLPLILMCMWLNLMLRIKTTSASKKDFIKAKINLRDVKVKIDKKSLLAFGVGNWHT
jgi:hypothetical protein